MNIAPALVYYTMKKLVLLSAVLLGTALAAQAGVHVSIGIGFPAPRPVIVSQPAPVIVQPAPQVVYQQPVQPEVVYQAPPVVYSSPQVVYSAPVVVTPAPVCVPASPIYYPAWHGHYGRGWDRHHDYRGRGDSRGYYAYDNARRGGDFHGRR